MGKYKVALFCNNCKRAWSIAVNKGCRIFEHSYGSTIVLDDCYYVDQSVYDNAITCPECECKTGVKKV